MAEDTIESISGVKDVNNQLRVENKREHQQAGQQTGSQQFGQQAGQQTGGQHTSQQTVGSQQLGGQQRPRNTE